MIAATRQVLPVAIWILFDWTVRCPQACPRPESIQYTLKQAKVTGWCSSAWVLISPVKFMNCQIFYFQLSTLLRPTARIPAVSRDWSLRIMPQKPATMARLTPLSITFSAPPPNQTSSIISMMATIQTRPLPGAAIIPSEEEAGAFPVATPTASKARLLPTLEPMARDEPEALNQVTTPIFMCRQILLPGMTASTRSPASWLELAQSGREPPPVTSSHKTAATQRVPPVATWTSFDSIMSRPQVCRRRGRIPYILCLENNTGLHLSVWTIT